MKQSEALDMITKIQLAHQAMESACKRLDELKEENKNLKEALAKQEQGEPVAWGMKNNYGRIYDCITPEEHEIEVCGYTIPLYTTPQQRKPLTERELLNFWLARFDVEGSPINNFARAIEAAHGIKE